MKNRNHLLSLLNIKVFNTEKSKYKYTLDVGFVAEEGKKTRSAVHLSRQKDDKLDKLVAFNEIKKIFMNENVNVENGSKKLILNNLDNILEDNNEYEILIFKK